MALFIEDLLHVRHCGTSVSTPLSLTMTLGKRTCYYPHFTEKETEAGRDELACPGSRRQIVENRDSRPRLSNPKECFLSPV